jgi:hypothetical protein
MCTLLLAASVVPGLPLVVVANRDEQLDRPSSPPSIWPAGFLAPRDDQAGGTWLGITPRGVFVGITNRYLGPREPARTSRGELVLRALALPTARRIHEAMAELRPADYNGFHLVYADADGGDVLATVSDGAVLAQLTLGRGLHALTEQSFGAGPDRRRLRIDAAWSRAHAGSFAPERLAGVLGEHDADDPLASTCIHLDTVRYGTRSAMILALADARTKSRMLWAEGPPCRAPFTEVAALGPLLASVPVAAEKR